jgi:hypothetical protein
MLILQILRTSLSAKGIKSFESFLSSVPNTYRSLIHPTLAHQAEILGFTTENLRNSEQERSRQYNFAAPSVARKGELFTDGSSLFIVTIRETDRARRSISISSEALEGETRTGSEFTLSLYYIGSELNSIGFQTLEKIVNTSFGVHLKPHYYRSERFDELKSEGRDSPQLPTRQQLEASRTLQDRAARTLGIAVKASGGLLVRDLAKQLPNDARDRTEEVTSSLKSAGLIDSEIVVVCNKTQAQTARVPSREILDELSRQGLKCACGRPIADERIEEALTITELGRTLLDGSRWLTFLLLEELEAVGIPLDKILAEQQLGGDELDLLVNISGELTFFELKDKEFNLGNAYSFGAKIGIIRPEHSVVVSTEHVGGDAKDHFQRARLARGAIFGEFVSDEGRDSEVRYIEGLAKLKEGISTLASQIYFSDAVRILNEILPLAAVNSSMLIRAVEARLNNGEADEAKTKAKSKRALGKAKKRIRSSKSSTPI